MGGGALRGRTEHLSDCPTLSPRPRSAFVPGPSPVVSGPLDRRHGRSRGERRKASYLLVTESTEQGGVWGVTPLPDGEQSRCCVCGKRARAGVLRASLGPVTQGEAGCVYRDAGCARRCAGTFSRFALIHAQPCRDGQSAVGTDGSRAVLPGPGHRSQAVCAVPGRESPCAGPSGPVPVGWPQVFPTALAPSAPPAPVALRL